MNIVPSMSQVVNVIMSQDPSENRQQLANANVVGQGSIPMPNGGPMLGPLENLMSAANRANELRPPVTFKSEIMDTEVNPF